jgi:hypothetical protein
MNKPHTSHTNPPPNHDQRQKDTRPQLLQQHIRQRLKNTVANEEYCQTGVVLAVCHAKVFLQAVDFSVTDVCAVEEGN